MKWVHKRYSGLLGPMANQEECPHLKLQLQFSFNCIVIEVGLKFTKSSDFSRDTGNLDFFLHKNLLGFFFLMCAFNSNSLKTFFRPNKTCDLAHKVSTCDL